MTVVLPNASRLSDSSSGRRCLNRGSRSSGRITVDLGLGAITGDMAGLTAAIAGLASSVERAAVGSSAVAGNVTWSSQLVFFGRNLNTHQAFHRHSTS